MAHKTKEIILGAALPIAALMMGAIVAGCSETGKHGVSSAVSPADMEKALHAYADCMRENGLPTFPEPTGDGLNLNGSGIDRDSQVFKDAQSTCSVHLPRPPDDANRPHRSGPGEQQGGRGEGNGRRISESNDFKWQRIVPGGDCECADGSEYAFFDAKVDSTKVVLYLDGGGVCFDAESCANQNTPGTGERPGPDYDPSIEGENPSNEGGLFLTDRANSPFAGFSFIYVPLCTADAHLGTATRTYSPELTVHHKGFVNGSAALNYLTKNYPDAAQIVVVGNTAGAAAAPLYGGLLADQLPNARVTVFGAQSGSFPNDPDLNAKTGELWGAYANMPNWDVNKGLTARDWGSQQLWIQVGRHNPKVALARFDFAFDPNAIGTLEYLKVPDPSNTLAKIDANEKLIEAAGVDLHSYVAPGNGHGILEFDIFYEMEVNGVKLADWVKALVDAKPLPDVHCDNCKE